MCQVMVARSAMGLEKQKMLNSRFDKYILINAPHYRFTHLLIFTHNDFRKILQKPLLYITTTSSTSTTHPPRTTGITGGAPFFHVLRMHEVQSNLANLEHCVPEFQGTSGWVYPVHVRVGPMV